MPRVTKQEGVTRMCFLVGDYAVKIPSLRSWGRFLCGLLNNSHEAHWSGKIEGVCPVLFSMPGGWFNVMPRCGTVPGYCDAVAVILDDPILKEWVEPKSSSFGYLRGVVVAVDFGRY